MLLFTDKLYGPYNSIAESEDRYHCDNEDLPKSVVGIGTVIDPELPAGFRADCYTWDGSKLVKVKEPEPVSEPVPDTIFMRQCCQQLLATQLGDGNALDAVETAISQMDKSAQIDWQRAQEVKRDWPLVIQMQALFGWSDDQMDQFFREAAKL
jgi:hypothetical protein